MLSFTGFFTVTMLAVVLVMVSKWNRGHRTEVMTEQELNALPHYRCPKCGVSMKPGLAVAGKGVFWRPIEGNTRSWLFGRSKPLPNTMNWNMRPYENRAWLCEQCNYLLLDHSAMVRVKKTPGV